MAEASTSIASSSTDQTPLEQQRRQEPLPGCYTVVWGSNTKEEPNFIKLSPTFGDGDAARWPDEGPDMTLLGNDHEKQRQWRKTAGELLAKDLGHFNNENATHWMLADLPKGYALFQQVTHPKGELAKKDGTEAGARAGAGGGSGKRLRLDRFIFGHEGRKIRSALSLGKHISWQLFDKTGPCPCDGCKIIGKAAEAGGSPALKGKKRGLEDGEDSGDVSSSRTGKGKTKLARTAASRAAAAKGKGGKKKGKGKEWEDEYDDEDEIMYDEEDDEEAAYSSDYTVGGGPRTTSSGRQSKPTSKAASGGVSSLIEAPNDEISNYMTPAPPEISYLSSHISVERVQEDLRMATCPRVGELIWCRVPLARPPGTQRKYIGDADFSRWPGIVRNRLIKGSGEDMQVRFTVELFAQNASDSLEGVKLENTLPWLQFVPANASHMDKLFWTWEQFREDGEKKGWGNIQVEGWPSVVGAYWRANRIAKCFSAIQIRSLPTIAVGTHLAAKSSTPATSRSQLQEMPPRSRFLTHSHVLYGPELVHVGDFVRLLPGTDLGPTIDRSNYDPTKSLLKLSLILHIQLIYRGGAGSPLMVRGPVYEMVELPPRNEHEYRTNPQAFSPEISTSILKTMPRPFPHHKWRLISNKSSRGEVDVLFEDIAGRYHALNRKIHENMEIVDHVLKRAEQIVEKKEDLNGWAISKGGYGLNGVDALRLTLAGLCGEHGTTRIIAKNGATGTRDDQLRIAEYQASVLPADPKHVGKPKPAAPVDPKVAAAAAAKQQARERAAATPTPATVIAGGTSKAAAPPAKAT